MSAKRISFTERLKRVEKRTRGMSPDARAAHLLINTWAYAPKSVLKRALAHTKVRAYTYRGDRLTDPVLRGKRCAAVLRADGKCVREDAPRAVLARQLRKVRT